jgi:hypothetical protein
MDDGSYSYSNFSAAVEEPAGGRSRAARARAGAGGARGKGRAASTVPAPVFDDDREHPSVVRRYAMKFDFVAGSNSGRTVAQAPAGMHRFAPRVAAHPGPVCSWAGGYHLRLSHLCACKTLCVSRAPAPPCPCAPPTLPCSRERNRVHARKSRQRKRVSWGCVAYRDAYDIQSRAAPCGPAPRVSYP